MTRRVEYFEPFTHYAAADMFRIFLLAAAGAATVSLLLLARLRWNEQRRSATVFLTGLALSLFVHAAASVVSLGHPPVWWLLILRAAVTVIAFAGCVLVIGEAKRGVWAREMS